MLLFLKRDPEEDGNKKVSDQIYTLRPVWMNVTTGNLGIIACPILEDELVYSLSRDAEEKNVFLVDNEPSEHIRTQLESYAVPYTMVDEWDIRNDDSLFDRDNQYNVIITMNKLGLHSEPKVLKDTIQDQILMTHSRFDSIALYYGMCGNAGWDISQWAAERLDTPVFVFRDDCNGVCDDCIGVAVGGTDRYYRLLKKYTGMLFVTPAMAINWDAFSKELDMCKGFDVLGIHDKKEVFKFYGYKNAVKLDTGLGARNEFDRMCDYVCEDTGLNLVIADPGHVTLSPAERIYAQAKGALNPGK